MAYLPKKQARLAKTWVVDKLCGSWYTYLIMINVEYVSIEEMCYRRLFDAITKTKARTAPDKFSTKVLGRKVAEYKRLLNKGVIQSRIDVRKYEDALDFGVSIDEYNHKLEIFEKRHTLR